MACASGPAGPGAAAAGLGVLVSAYGFASVLYAPGLPLLHGLVLLALLAACLWAPDLRGTRLALAGACVALAALIAVPVAAALDRERPVVDYRAWTWTGGQPSVGFAWNHPYGPLDWPRRGNCAPRDPSRRGALLALGGAGAIRRLSLGAHRPGRRAARAAESHRGDGRAHPRRLVRDHRGHGPRAAKRRWW